MTLSFETPTCDQLVELAEELAQWQQIPWAGQLHPGDLGWHSSVGAERLAGDLRVWKNGTRPVALGMLDGPGLIRFAIAPDCTADESLAHAMAGDLENPSGLFPDDPVNVVEARGATALQAELRRRGWAEDEEWTPLVLELAGEPRWEQLEQSGLRIEIVGAEEAAEWTAVHWSSFKGTPYTDEAREGFVRRWSTLMTSPLADHAQSLIGYDSTGAAVAVTTVWSAGEGRPGLVEPMGVHRDHQGKGYGVAITQAGAQALHQAGASAAAVVAENSNPAALATYTAAGFTAGASVSDLARP
ncbi:GNAT family N-acetyltransferase [Micrococcus luteus]|uniref:GCN5-related N-acetyltransferase n=1 Tax=Micrococcus sp. V7 TaxID=404582 RepID=U5NZL6_9MICC|nr:MULTISPECIES: GNAT family N-acetyltransferase [Actinomycetes]AGY35484.1 GCN5-related N-acetyltransferase [Micrococcus sp. V7]MBE1538129.1 ribosomal protein S18 acetylase RimI-like enzyme [Micrococcus yunnanensis]MCK6091320.1 GNAT family N-acetyltransferase [Micrococcus endophyticus]MEA5660450.1 GNAT family N-acetyltransferase [Cutibacterium granulosum]